MKMQTDLLMEGFRPRSDLHIGAVLEGIAVTRLFLSYTMDLHR